MHYEMCVKKVDSLFGICLVKSKSKLFKSGLSSQDKDTGLPTIF